MIDILNKNKRAEIIKSIHTRENVVRKVKSYIENDIYKDNIEPYVRQSLVSQLSEETVCSMPIIGSINIGKKIAKTEASIYKRKPKRSYISENEQSKNIIDSLEDAKINTHMQRANEMYKYQYQSFLYVVPRDGKIEIKNILPHNVDVIPNDENPEKHDVIIMSAFDRGMYMGGLDNMVIADRNDYKMLTERYTFWSKDHNFVTDGYGEIVSGDSITNPIGVIPFVDISRDKDYNYFVDMCSILSGFTIQYNSALSDIANIVRLQGYAQAVYTGPADMLPERINLGPNFVLRLPINPNNPTATDFKFVSPTPDIDGSLQSIEQVLANFLSSRGIDTAVITGKLGESKKFSSGIERLLAMIENFEASEADFDLFFDAEKIVFEVAKQWLIYANGTDILDKKYHFSGSIDDAVLTLEYKKPEDYMSEKDKIELIARKRELGFVSKVEALSEARGITIEQAQDILDKQEDDKDIEDQQVEVIDGEDQQPKSN